ncbi:MAG: dihydrofolate reductase [Ignavibacteria bacterium]|nr:dihydrofolate reductase [Ignavibacteria bacterium]
MIFATSDNGVIGKDNKLLWHLPNDLKLFKKLTSNKIVIMGRKTYDSLPNKPLPNRLNVVLCNDDPTFSPDPSVIVLETVNEVLDFVKNYNDESFIIGGGMIYKLFLPYVDKIYMTTVHVDVEGDTYAPVIFDYQWKILNHEELCKDDTHSYDYSFTILKKVK